jgi:hypothetical protein
MLTDPPTAGALLKRHAANMYEHRNSCMWAIVKLAPLRATCDSVFDDSKGGAVANRVD